MAEKTGERKHQILQTLAQMLEQPAGEKVTYHEELWNRFIFAAIAVFLFLLVIPILALNIRRFRREV